MWKFLLALLAVAAANHEFQFEDGVLVLTHSNFEAAVKHFKILLVDFYAPWCPHCQNLAPEFAIAAQKLKKEDIVLAKVDCTVETFLAHRFQVHGYPTLKIFANEVEFAYHGRRTADEIVDYMHRHKDYINLTMHQHLQKSLHQKNILQKNLLANSKQHYKRTDRTSHKHHQHKEKQ